MWHAFAMIKTMVTVQGDLTHEEANRAALSLMAMGMEARIDRAAASAGGPMAWQVSVPEDDAEAAGPLLRDALTVDRIPPKAERSSVFGSAGAGIWTWRNAWSSVLLVAGCTVVHVLVHSGTSPAARSDMMAAGAVAPWLVSQGEWWRLASAVFLHFDLKHLIGNMSALLFLGPPLAAQIGHGRTLALFVASGVAGNVVSQVLGNEAAVKAGASGGVCGLLGALDGVALAVLASSTDIRRRRPAWQTLGALLALFAMIIGVQPGSDHYAHVGGLLAGLLLGRLFGLKVSDDHKPAAPEAGW